MAVELYDEHEQGERVRKWIREYGTAIAAGLILAFGGIFGFRYWQDHQTAQSLLAADFFNVVQNEVEAGRTELAAEQLELMREQVPRSAYVGLAGLALASAYVDEGRLEPAARLYRDVLDDRRLSTLWPVTRLRLARVLEAQGDVREALALIEDHSAPPGFGQAWAELRGDLLINLGDTDAARLAFQEALELAEGSGPTERLLQMKIDATGPGGEERS
ncbi:MAG: hypothetical protein EA419_02590 [Wenzhouxiangella sp.]|nr:MAG: hypothetical protein EA419_02590 [Wenzhouxiangella sp.]